MTTRLRPVLLLLIAAALLLPAGASAGTVAGTVIAPATADAAGRTTLPVLLNRRSERKARHVVVAPVVPRGAKPVVWGSNRLALGQLRPGDVVSLDLRGNRARRLELERSGKADDFDRVLKQFAALDAVARRTVELGTPLAANATGSAPRDQITALRTQVSELEAALDGIDADVQTSLTRLGQVRPREERRRVPVVAAQQPYEQKLIAIRDAARATARQAALAAEVLDAVAAVPGSNDGTQVHVDPAFPMELPFGSISTISALLGEIVILADQLGIAEPPLVG